MKKSILLFCFSFILTTQLTNAQTNELWGMTPYGGRDSVGVIFKMNSNGTGFDTVYSFNDSIPASSYIHGFTPEGDLLQSSNGYLYGTTFYGGPYRFGSIFRFNPDSDTYQDVHFFDTTTGIQSNGSLIQVNGNLYGMAGASGANNYGVIFRFNPDSNTYKDIYDFNGAQGSYPYGNLLASGNGLLYGMTQYGGAYGDGIIFSFDTLNNTLIDLHDFDSTDGQWPFGSLVQAGNKLYGLTWSGGANDLGVLFNYDITTNVFTKSYDFNFNSGDEPEGNLTLIPGTGVFYGATNEGGANNDGVIFSFDTSTNTYSDLFDFADSNGEAPPAGLLLGSNGNLIGMTYFGGTDSDGVIFSFNPSDSDCIDIHNFNTIEGENPNGNLIETNTAGIQQLAANNNQLLIYPNPASNQLTIINKQSSISEIRITNIMGQVVYTFTLPKEQYRTQIDVNSLPSGLYFVSVTSNNQIITNKISIINK